MHTPPSPWDTIDNLCAGHIREDATAAITLAVADRERTLLVRAYGLADREAGRPATPATAFAIGSVGKAFASLMVLQLCEQGLLDLHAPIGAYLPWLELEAPVPITLHHLLSHTAGLPEDGEPSPAPRADAHGLAGAGPFVAGGEFHYSNLGYNLIGYLLEDVLGQPYSALLRARILEPLGMAATWPAINQEARAHMAAGYLQDPTGALVPAPFEPCAVASGCSASPAGDMAIYGRMLLNQGRGDGGHLISPTSFARLTQPLVPAWGGHYGYGLVSSTLDGRRCIGHRGETAGFKAYVLADQDAGLAVAALVSGEAEPIELGERTLQAARRA
jgi:CubicO group peptidase (beta-lactamase class C family)